MFSKNSALRGISYHIYTLMPSQKPQENLVFAAFCSSEWGFLHFAHGQWSYHVFIHII